jgi:signal peptidase I
VRIADTGADVFTYDRFLVNKLLPLRRWDLVLYRAPHKKEGTVRFVKRLVGLPGEQVVIKEGAVWINGERMEAPEDIAGLEYQTQIESIGSMVPARWGTPENPAVLGPDEYFVLGDFTLRSHDCRMWHRGVGDHPPYALPYDHIEGVVTLVYWPQSRWRLIR